jgi:hypothetical protein
MKILVALDILFYDIYSQLAAMMPEFMILSFYAISTRGEDKG